jgi:hypothetical protein
MRCSARYFGLPARNCDGNAAPKSSSFCEIAQSRHDTHADNPTATFMRLLSAAAHDRITQKA